MPDMKIDSRLLDIIYDQLYTYYMRLTDAGEDIPLDLLHAMDSLERKFRRSAEREDYRKKKGYR